jgi:hypothetical protein
MEKQVYSLAMDNRKYHILFSKRPFTFTRRRDTRGFAGPILHLYTKYFNMKLREG